MSRTRVVLVGLLGLTLVLLVMVAGSGSTVEAFTDGRVNCHAASPVAIYCTDDGILVMGILGAENGQELLKISDEILANAVVPEGAEFVELGQSADGGVLALLLKDGRYLVTYVNTERDPDELFTVFWEGCGPGTADAGDIKVYTWPPPLALVSDADGCGGDGFDETCEGVQVCDQACIDKCEGNADCLALTDPGCCYNTCAGESECVTCVLSHDYPFVPCIEACQIDCEVVCILCNGTIEECGVCLDECPTPP
ncbi:hypothetical protein ACFLYO_02420 [Chloroflexota bacterium]